MSTRSVVFCTVRSHIRRNSRIVSLSMKMTHVRTHVLEAKLSQPFAYSRAWYATRMAMIVEIETDDGVVGWGECYGPALDECRRR